MTRDSALPKTPHTDGSTVNSLPEIDQAPAGIVTELPSSSTAAAVAPDATDKVSLVSTSAVPDNRSKVTEDWSTPRLALSAVTVGRSLVPVTVTVTVSTSTAP